jgi:hypothetical protein
LRTSLTAASNRSTVRSVLKSLIGIGRITYPLNKNSILIATLMLCSLLATGAHGVLEGMALQPRHSQSGLQPISGLRTTPSV